MNPNVSFSIMDRNDTAIIIRYKWEVITSDLTIKIEDLDDLVDFIRDFQRKERRRRLKNNVHR